MLKKTMIDKWDSVVLLKSIPFVDEKHVSTVTVGNFWDQEVELSESEGEDDNTDTILVVSQSKQLIVSLCLHWKELAQISC